MPHVKQIMSTHFIYLLIDLMVTGYKHAIPCGDATFCHFGATCSLANEYVTTGEKLPNCLCEIDCSLDSKRVKSERSLVCASDGNTYHSECHVRQHSCRIQKEIKIVNKRACVGKKYMYHKTQFHK